LNKEQSKRATDSLRGHRYGNHVCATADQRSFAAVHPRIILEPTVIANADYRYGFGGTFSALPRLYIETTYGTFSPYGSAVSADTSAQRPSDFHGMADYTLSPHWSVSANFGTSGDCPTAEKLSKVGPARPEVPKLR